MANIRTGRKSGFILRGGVRRRETLWFDVPESVNTLAAANSAVIVSTLATAAKNLRPFTIIRSRLNWHCRSDQTGALERYQVAMGLAVVSDQATAIGVTAVPTPFTDLFSDLWFLHQITAGNFTFVSGIGFDPVGGIEKDIDSKAMRKVEDGQDLVFVLENSAQSSGSTNITAGRLLIKLH